MVESSNLASKYKHIFSFRKYTFEYQGLLNFADAAFFAKNQCCFEQNSAFTQSNSVRALLENF